MTRQKSLLEYQEERARAQSANIMQFLGQMFIISMISFTLSFLIYEAIN